MISKAFKTVFFKEVMENLRDKRTLMSSVIMGSFMGPLFALGMIYMTAQMGKEIPDFSPGDTVIVQVKVKEGERERLQAYENESWAIQSALPCL